MANLILTEDNVTRENAKKWSRLAVPFDDHIDVIFDSFEKELKDLKHYYDTTVGMFVTDTPDLVDDSIHRVLFELEEIVT